MKLLVYEFLSGGGFAEKQIPLGVLSEGFGMLRMLTADFKAAGHFVATVLDSRFAAWNPPLEADIVKPVSSSETAKAAVFESAKSADAVCVIAPESGNTLQSLVKSLEDHGANSLNCSSSGIGEVSDKPVFQMRAKQLGLHVPETIIMNLNDSVEEITRSVEKEIGFPAVFKPVDGAGCAGLNMVANNNGVANAVSRIAGETSREVFMVQEFIQGEPASVSVMSTGKEASPISLNGQTVSMATDGTSFSYEGGVVPFGSSLAGDTLAAAKRVVESCRGLAGYVGVDFVLTWEKPVVLELNPRLTTSYVGLREVAGFNVAQAILDSVFDHKLPDRTQNMGFARFSKIWTPKPTRETFREACEVPGLVSPPFSLPETAGACALLSSRGETVEEANMKFAENQTRLFTAVGGGGG